MYWVGFPLAIAISLFRRPGRGARAARRRAGAGELPRRAARLPAGGGAGDGGAGRAGAARLPRRPRRPRPARPRAAPLAALPARGSPSSASSTTRSGRARRPATRAAGAGTGRALREGRLSTGAIKAIGALALAAYVVSGRGLEDVALPRRRGAADPRHQPLQPARPAAGAGGEGPGAARRRASASAPGRWRRSNCSGSSSGRSWSAPG